MINNKYCEIVNEDESKLYNLASATSKGESYSRSIPFCSTERQDDNLRLSKSSELIGGEQNHNAFFKSAYEIINKWEGVVEKIDGDNIFAKLYDYSDESFNFLEFDKEDISSDDLELLEEGALFFLYIGYYTNERGTRLKTHRYKFRRFPKWDEEQVNQGLENILELNWDDIWENE